jgi:signal transduction histidine kinase
LAITVYSLMALGALTGNPLFRRMQPLATLLFYAGTAYAVTSYRIFDARQIVLVGTQKIVLIAIVTGVAAVVEFAAELVMQQALAMLVTTAVALWVASLLNAYLDRVLQFYPKASSARHAAFLVSQRESRLEKLEAAFLGVLRGWGHSDNALILAASGATNENFSRRLSETEVVIRAIKQLRWVSPERLVRERTSPDREALDRFLAENQLGVLVIAEGPSFHALVGVGVPASRRPYTYPQVMELMELASIMESALERAHFSAKVQRTEQLATVGLVGASLAHEIRNPLVSIKTFVQLLPTHHQDPVFREKFFRLIGDEVKRIDQLTEQLLDLSAPRNYKPERMELHAVLRGGLELVAAKAAEKKVQFQTEFEANPDTVLTDPAAAKQVMLNLCFNAIQAVESGTDGDRWIKVSTRTVKDGVEMAVSDSGPGIAPEMHPKLFQPFQTTKSTGFGLGLAICRDILANLQASISVDPPVPGKGATFRVIYPCQAS